MERFLSFNRISKYVIAALLLISKTSFAGLLMPIGVNDMYIYDKYNSQKSWTFTIQGLELVDVGGIEYIKILSCNESGDGSCNEMQMRSTENAVYLSDGSIVAQTAPVGTTWSYPSSRDGRSGVDVNKIVSIESVTVPYGSFSNAYINQVYFDADDPSIPDTEYWYDYFVPDIGWVKQIDFSSSSIAILELRDITTVPIPAALWMFISGILSLATFAKSRCRDIYMTNR